MTTFTIKKTERESTRLFSDNIGLHYIRLNSDYNTIDINRIAKLLLGFEPKNMLKKNLIGYCELMSLACPIVIPVNSDIPLMVTKTTHGCRNGAIVRIEWNIIKEIDDREILQGWILIGKVIEFLDNKYKTKQLKFIEKILNTFPIGIFFKDTDGKYLFNNRYLLKISGFKHNNTMVGKTDYDMSWADITEVLIAHDQLVAEKGTTIFKEELKLDDGGNRTYLTTKSSFRPMLSKQSVGTIGICFDLKTFKQHQLANEESWLDHIGNGLNLSFTAREKECINWLIKGKSAYEISLILGISQRTVESHTENIKYKAQCHKQVQLGYLLGKYGELFM